MPHSCCRSCSTAWSALVIVARGKRNVLHYPYRENFRYTLQRWTGVIAFAFILWHVFQTRGWLPDQWWMDARHPAAGRGDVRSAATRRPPPRRPSRRRRWWPIAYVVGVLASVYHLANGLWTMGITWGVWTSPDAQRWANVPCAAGRAVGLGAWSACWRRSVGMQA